MASLTISGVITTGVTLTEPTSITSTGTITSPGSAAVGGSGSGSLVNSGEIAGEVFGVSLAAGGNITNTDAGVISGASGIALFGPGTIDNAGVISGGGAGIILSSGAIINEISGDIFGGVSFTTGTLTNQGLISRATGNIVYFAAGGTVLNLGATANLTGGDVVGVAIAGGIGQVTNQGSISGVELFSGGTVTNAGYLSTGNASFGVVITQDAGYVQNTGHIVGVDLASGGKIVNSSGAIISGYIDGADLGNGGSISNNGSILGIGGRLSGLQSGRDGISLSGNGTITNASGAVIRGSNDGIFLTGTGSGSSTITNDGLITGKKGIVVDTNIATTIFNYGTIAGTGGTAIYFEGGNDVLVLGSDAVIEGIIVGGNPTQQASLTIQGTMSNTSSDIQLEAGGNLILNGAIAAAQTISFAGTDAKLAIGDASQFASQIAGMAPGDMIDLTNDAYDPAGRAYLTTNNVLEIVGTQTTTLQLDPKQYFGNEYFHISSDGLNGTDVTESSVPCFLAGTRIAVPHGQALVEELKLGDLVLTGTGAAKPVKWIGRRSYLAPLADDPDIIPVLIKAGALAPDIPAEDLYLSPRHAVLIGGFLVPAGALINGVSVLSCTDIKTIRYYHVEMDQHDTVFANGAEAETFIDHDSRKMFENADEFYRLYPLGWAASVVLCAPRLEFGAELEALRRKIALRAGLLLDQVSDAVIGFLESVDRQSITGWACAPAQPNLPVSLGIYNRGALLARTVANIMRPDVRAAGFGNGRCGFKVTLPAPLPALLRHEISVVPIGGAVPLTGSPVVLDPALAHDLLRTGGLKTLIDAAVNGSGSDRDIVDLGKYLEAAGRQIRQGAEAPHQTARAGKQSPGLPVVLMIDNKWPTVTLDAGSNAIMSHVRAFQSLGYRVAFCATSGISKNTEEAAGLCALQELGAVCYGQDGEAAETIIRRLAADGLSAVYLHRLAIASAYGVLVRQHARGAKVIFAVADLHHLRLARQADVCRRPDLAFKARSIKASELWAMQLADAVLTHSQTEAAYLKREAPFANVHLVPWSVALQTPAGAGRNRRDVAFIGGAGHAPNLDAVMLLVRELMPMVWKEDPLIRCLVVGPDWPLNVFQSVDPRIVHLGHQQDLRALLRSVRLTVAPLRFGAGIKGKVLESMAAGVPCVMSTIAAEGLPLEPDLNALIGDDREFSDKLLTLYSDKKLYRIVAQAGLDMIQTNFSFDAVIQALARALDQKPSVRSLRDVPAERPLTLAI